jgi:hypothetical protein
VCDGGTLETVVEKGAIEETPAEGVSTSHAL